MKLKKTILFAVTLLLLCVILVACGTKKPDAPQETGTDGESTAHEHRWSEWLTVKAATCTELGLQAKLCACGETVTQHTDRIPHTEVIDAAVLPTYTQTGLTEGRHCSVCGEIVIEQQVIDRLKNPEEPALSVVSKLKVCSFNVGLYNSGIWVANNPYNSYSDIVSAYRQFLNGGAFDLIGLQEGTNIKGTINADVYAPLLPNHVYDGNMHTNIWTAYPILSQKTGVLKDGTRGYSSATLLIDGKEIFVMSVHFGLDGPIQQANAMEVLQILEGHEYAVVFGDFNAGNGDVSAESLYSCFTDAGYRTALGDYLPFESTVKNSNVKYYDNIITTSNIIMRDVHVGDGDGLYSDHLPVFAELLIMDTE